MAEVFEYSFDDYTFTIEEGDFVATPTEGNPSTISLSSNQLFTTVNGVLKVTAGTLEDEYGQGLTDHWVVFDTSLYSLLDIKKKDVSFPGGAVEKYVLRADNVQDVFLDAYFPGSSGNDFTHNVDLVAKWVQLKIDSDDRLLVRFVSGTKDWLRME